MRRWTLAAGCLALAGCSLFPDVPPVVDQGGSAGVAGAGGGAAGSGGTAGMAGSAGTGGAAGTSGAAGNGGSGGSCAPQSLSLEPVADTYIQRTPPGVHGAEPMLQVGGSNNSGRRGMLRFDLSTLPAGVELQRAELALVPTQAQPGVGLIGVHRVTTGWEESEATWAAPMSGFGWDGGDFVLLPTVVGDLSNAALGQAVSFDVTSDVKLHIADPGQNFGWLLLDENFTGANLVLASREAADKRPALELSYCP